jgi:hypothetical protein
MSVSTQGSIEEQVAWLTDRTQIHDLVLSYARVADSKDWQGYADLFAEEGRIIWPYGDIPKKDIARSIARILEPFEATHHMLTNIGITIDGDTARTHHYLQSVHLPVASEPGQHSDVGGWYNNEYRRTPAGWRIVSLDLTFVWTSGLPFQPGDPAS